MVGGCGERVERAVEDAVHLVGNRFDLAQELLERRCHGLGMVYKRRKTLLVWRRPWTYASIRSRVPLDRLGLERVGDRVEDDAHPAIGAVVRVVEGADDVAVAPAVLALEELLGAAPRLGDGRRDAPGLGEGATEEGVRVTGRLAPVDPGGGVAGAAQQVDVERGGHPDDLLLVVQDGGLQGCRRRRSGRRRREAGWPGIGSPGEIRSATARGTTTVVRRTSLDAARRTTSARRGSSIRTTTTACTRSRLRWIRSHRRGTAYTTWRGTCGNGVGTGMIGGGTGALGRVPRIRGVRVRARTAWFGAAVGSTTRSTCGARTATGPRRTSGTASTASGGPKVSPSRSADAE